MNPNILDTHPTGNCFVAKLSYNGLPKRGNAPPNKDLTKPLLENTLAT